MGGKGVVDKEMCVCVCVCVCMCLQETVEGEKR